MKKTKMFSLIILLIISIFPNTNFPMLIGANGVTIKVPEDYSTIQEAVDNANPGDTVYVYNGTYKENVFINATITLQGQDKGNTFIDGNGGFAVNVNADNVVVKGFTLFNASHGIIVFNDDNLTVHDCIIQGCSEYGVYLWGSDLAVMENCTIYDCGVCCIYLNLLEMPEIQGCTVYDSGGDGIYVLNSNYVYIADCNFSSNEGFGGFISGSHDVIINECGFYDNNYTGVYLECDERITLLSNTIHDNQASGIWVQGTNEAEITCCDVYNNTWDGVTVSSSDFLEVSNCLLFLNGDNGIALLESSDFASIRDSEIFANENNGINMYNSHIASICSTYSNLNAIGFYAHTCNELYVTSSDFSSNVWEGIHLASSEGVLVNSNFTNNPDIGAYAAASGIISRYCSFTDNGVYGAQSDSSRFDAVDCWWGNSSGPYHVTENPSGTGDEVTWGVEFDPWQAALYQPDTLIGDLRCHLRGLQWLVVYPDQDTPKPLGCASAMVSDWLSSAFITTRLENYIEGLDTDSLYVNQTSGEVKGSSGIGVLSFGGPVVNPLVKRAEDVGTPASDRAPVKYHGEAGNSYFQYSNGVNIPGAVLPNSVINDDQDMFVIERFEDSQQRIITLCYGFGWQGTYAAGKYFDKQVLPNLASYTEGWVIVKWDDTNMNGFVDNPNEGDTYTFIAAGH